MAAYVPGRQRRPAGLHAAPAARPPTPPPAPTHPSSQVELLLTLEEWCGEEGQFHRAGARGAAFAPAFADLLHLLYDADILEEGAVLAWAGEKAHADAGDRAFLERAAPFVTWLREAEEESSEGE